MYQPPVPKYSFDKYKRICRVCKKPLRLPVREKTQAQRVYQRLHARAVCTFECLLAAFDDIESLSDKLYEEIYTLVDKTEELEELYAQARE